MIRNAWISSAFTILLLACGGADPSAAVDPATDEFTISDADRDALEEAAETGEGAEGSYSFDDASSTLTITIASSTFDCGPQVGTIIATVQTVNEEELVLRFEGDDGDVVFTRVDEGGDGLVGIWRTSNPDLYLILAPDGSAQIFGEQEVCNEDRPRNEESCLLVEPPAASIVVDGNLDDWDGVGSLAATTDPVGDHVGDDSGADVVGSRVAFSDGTVFVLTELAADPSESFQNSSAPNGGSYRLVVQGYNGLSEEATLYYGPGSETWELMSFGSGVAAAVGPLGIEWSVDISGSLGEGFESVDFIMVEPRDCSVGSCQILDAVECAYFEL